MAIWLSYMTLRADTRSRPDSPATAFFSAFRPRAVVAPSANWFSKWWADFLAWGVFAVLGTVALGGSYWLSGFWCWDGGEGYYDLVSWICRVFPEKITLKTIAACFQTENTITETSQ